MVGRLVRKADFERVLAVPARSRSAHFAVHHVPARPSTPAPRGPKPVPNELSTACEPNCPQPVDDCVSGQWLGLVVPKRHARRAVTRNLLRRQVRAALARHADALPQGLFVVRLRAGFDPKRFPSAASLALGRAARDELDTMLSRLELHHA